MAVSGSPATGIQVEVRRGPISPVTRVGVDNTAPMPEARVRVVNQTRKEVAQAVTDAQGRSTVRLAPGTYEVMVMNCAGIRVGASEPVEATVTADAMTPVRIECDTGIR
ncbi:carboxypeptidase regulatory-like domain-containing protein [Anthocerotibacter panamensis]|uniref:carboxypeptidase regulatory-like domain-containing protein n=1 Tax=Anthocerotibacter panamensis TaxID=2857077 RepID=UPI001C405310|nr:carboxypeptidase regulatory-like domain-containing protein [Anthocerotibacter panamensis]